MKSRFLASFTALALIGISVFAAQHDPMVGGAAMYPSKNIVENAVNSADHTTLVAAVKAAGLVNTLESAGPFTVFAPVNAAFTALPAGTVDTLIRKGNGSVELKTVSGGELTFMKNGPHNIVVKDETGATADITVYDVMQ